MEKVKTVLRYGETTRLGEQQIARAMNVFRTAVSKYAHPFRSSGLGLEELEWMTENELSANWPAPGNRPRVLAMPLCAPVVRRAMLKELRKQGVSLERRLVEHTGASCS